MRGEGRSAGAVVPLDQGGCEGLDCSSGSLEAPLCWAPLCVRDKPAPGGVLATQVEPSRTVTEPAMTVTRS
jgi:hypothetical protein